MELLLDKQVDLITQLNHSQQTVKQPIDAMYIRALGLYKSNRFEAAEKLLKELLLQKEDYHQARLLLAEVFMAAKQYDEATSELNTLKATSAYQDYSTEIELKQAEIKLIKNQCQQVIDDLKNYQANNLMINEVKKAKIQLSLGDAYAAMGNSQKAMQAFNKAIANIDELINPKIYAQSYYGQGSVLFHNANDNKVYALFEQSYVYAKSAADLPLQAKSLNAMARNKLLQNQWEKSCRVNQKIYSSDGIDR